MTFYKVFHFKYVVIILAVLITIFTILLILTNNKVIIYDDVEEIHFSKESGFYNDEFDLEISSLNGTIYYTLDGSVPTCDSIKYEGPIHVSDASLKDNTYSMREDISYMYVKNKIVENYYEEKSLAGPQYNIDKCNIVRAIIYYGGDRYSEVKTASYFIGFEDKNGYDSMNIISIVTDPDNLFGYENGIYIAGKYFDDTVVGNKENFMDEELDSRFWNANYTLSGIESEREVSCQFFDVKRNLVLSQACGIRIHGGATRSSSQKSFNLYARDEYNGENYFYSDFFGNEYSPHSICLSQGGNDDSCKLNDYLINDLTSYQNFSTMDFVPYVLFLNGEYWGVYWMTEKYDKEYIHYHYGVDSNNVIIVKENYLKEGESRDYEEYSKMMDFCTNSDMSIVDNYRQACELIDIDSYIDYYATMIYLCRHSDWPVGNEALWRSRKTGDGKYEDGKWRWMLFDVNWGAMDERNVAYDSIEYTMEKSPMFANMMCSNDFKNKLLNKLSELSNTIFIYRNVENKISDFRLLMDEPMLYNNKRFYGDGSDNMYLGHLEEIGNYFEKRGDNMKSIITKYR